MTLAEYAACLVCLRRERQLTRQQRQEQAGRVRNLKRGVIIRHLRAGRTYAEIAELERVVYGSLKNRIAREGLDIFSGYTVPPSQHPEQVVLLPDLARDLDISTDMIYGHLRRGRVSSSRYGGRHVFSPAQVEAARGFYGQRRAG